MSLLLKSMLQEFGVEHSQPLELICDNKVVIYIASNPIFYERTKHIEVDCHFIHERISHNILKTPHMASEN